MDANGRECLVGVNWRSFAVSGSELGFVRAWGSAEAVGISVGGENMCEDSPESGFWESVGNQLVGEGPPG